MTIAKFKCPICGSNEGLFRSSRKIETYDDLIGTICASCGHPLTDEEVKRQAAQIAEEIISKALKNLAR